MEDFLVTIEGKVLSFVAKELTSLVGDEAKMLESGINAVTSAIKAGQDWETAVTTQLNILFQGEVTEGKKIIAAFLSFVGRLTHHLVG